MKYYVFGDIHGELKKLEELLSGITVDKNSKIVFLGDYVDRGKKSAQVLSLVKSLVDEGKAILYTGACFEGGKLTCVLFEEGNRKPLEVRQA